MAPSVCSVTSGPGRHVYTLSALLQPTPPSLTPPALSTDMSTGPEGRHERLRERVEQNDNLGSDSNHGSHRLDVSSQNPNQNVIQGPGNIFNYNPITNNVVYGDTSNEPDTERAKIFTVLESQHVPRAVFGAQIEKGCMEGTRVQILRDIEAWIKDPNGPQIFWLAGMAGTGKSAIAWTVCLRASKDSETILGGSFFCSRSTGLGGQRDVRCVVPTLALLLSRQSASFSQALAAELDADPDILHQQVEVQVEKLLYRPLLALKDSPIPIIFVVDALDECSAQLTANGALDDGETHRIVSDMLEALVAFSRSEVKVPVKFLVTSRPETHIRDTHVSDIAFSKVLRLHTVDKQQVAADIRLYITNRLLNTPKFRTLFTEHDVSSLVRVCDGLFIVAATALEHVLGAGTEVAVVRFKLLLNTAKDRLVGGATARLDRTYGMILEEASKADAVETDQLPRLLRALSAVLAARMTLSVAALSDLTNTPTDHLRAVLSRIHAVIHVPDDDDNASLRPLHASFGDYLLGRAATRLRIDESLGHRTLTDGCLSVMENHLYFNVSRRRSSFEQNPSTKLTSIALSLEYACLQWTHHVSGLLAAQSKSDSNFSSALRSRFKSWINRKPLSSLQSELDEKINAIFRPRLLFWLEAMSMLCQVQRAAAMLVFSAATVKGKELQQFLRDANSFVASSREAIERSAAHIYISALPFAHKDSLVYRDFSSRCSGLVTVKLIGVAHHAGRLVMTLTGHEAAVNSVAYDPDGNLLISGSTDGTVRIWDMRTGEESMTPLCSGDGAVLSVAFAPDAESAASGTEAGIICVWPLLAALAIPQRLRGHSAAISSVQFSPDGTLLASASLDKTIRVWGAQTGRKIAVLCGHSMRINALSFAPDSLTLLSGSEDRTIQLWNVATGKPMYSSPHHHNQPIYSVCFLPDGQAIAAGCGNHVILCKLQTGRKSRTLYSNLGPIRSIHPSREGQSLVVAHDNSVCLSSVPRLTARSSTAILDGHTENVRAVTFAPDSAHVASASEDCTIRIWNATGRSEPLPPTENSGKADETTVSTFIMSDARALMGHTGMVHSMAVSLDDTFIVSGSEDSSVRVWDVQAGNQKFLPLLGHTNDVLFVNVSSDGRMIASASADHTIRLWSAQTGGAVGLPMRGHTSYVQSVAFTSDTRWLASGANDNTVLIWDVVAQRLSTVGPLVCPDYVNTVAFSPDDKLVAAGDQGGLIHLWTRATGQPLHEPIKSTNSPVYSVSFSSDGRHIVSGHGDSLVHIWIVSTGSRALTLTGHIKSVQSVKYSTDNQFIVSGSCDRTVRLWNARTGALIATLRGHNDDVNGVAYAANGRFIVSAADDKSIRIWHLTDTARAYLRSDEDPSAALDSAILDNGWLTGSSGELLLWIPNEYRQHLHNLRTYPRRVEIIAGSSGWHRGESWTSCWRNDAFTNFLVGPLQWPQFAHVPHVIMTSLLHHNDITLVGLHLQPFGNPLPLYLNYTCTPACKIMHEVSKTGTWRHFLCL